MDPVDRIRLERGASHLSRLGPRAIAEAFAELTFRTDGLSAALAVLDQYQHLSPRVLAAVGGDRFPPRPLRAVP